MHPLISILRCIDAALGRFDVLALSDQARMELLMRGLGETVAAKFQSEKGEFSDITDWGIVEFDADGSVNRVHFDFAVYKRGLCTLNLELIPPHVTAFTFQLGKVEGTFVAHMLPRGLEYLDISRTQVMHGSLDTANLPPNLVRIGLQRNALRGEVDFTVLPGALEQLNLQGNKFSGSVDLTSLPRALQYLLVGRNNFSGELDLQSLPGAMDVLDLSYNDFSGSLSAVNLPHNLRCIDVEKCVKFDETAVLAASYEGVIRCAWSSIRLLVDESGQEVRRFA